MGNWNSNLKIVKHVDFNLGATYASSSIETIIKKAIDDGYLPANMVSIGRLSAGSQRTVIGFNYLSAANERYGCYLLLSYNSNGSGIVNINNNTYSKHDIF